jgi:hypothetical protein
MCFWCVRVPVAYKRRYGRARGYMLTNPANHLWISSGKPACYHFCFVSFDPYRPSWKNGQRSSEKTQGIYMYILLTGTYRRSIPSCSSYNIGRHLLSLPNAILGDLVSFLRLMASSCSKSRRKEKSHRSLGTAIICPHLKTKTIRRVQTRSLVSANPERSRVGISLGA